MISIEEYLMGREKQYPLNDEQHRNALNLIARVNALLLRLKMDRRVTSGYRPGHYNAKAGGAKRSAHLTCEAVDLEDKDGELAKTILLQKNLLEEFDLYLENPSYTKGWVHLDRRKRKNRVFIPY